MTQARAVLVTGVSGCVAGTLARRLSDAGARVRALVRTTRQEADGRRGPYVSRCLGYRPSRGFTETIAELVALAGR